MSHTRKRLAVATVCVLTLAVSACSSDSKGSSATGAGAPVALTIENRVYTAGTITAGTAFTVANKDGVTHTVTDDAGSFDVQVGGGGTSTLTITKAGTYQVHCKIHTSMHGTITVG